MIRRPSATAPPSKAPPPAPAPAAPPALGRAQPVGGHPLVGPALMVAAVFVFSTAEASGKSLTTGYSVLMLMLFRGAAGGVLLLPAIVRRGWQAVRPHNVVAQVALGACHVVSLSSFFLALRYITLPDAVAIGFSSPILSTLMASVLLGERMRPRQWAAIVGGFLGVLVIVRPGGAIDPFGAGLMLVSVISYAGMQNLVRWAGRTDTPLTTAAATCVFSTTVGLIAAPWVWRTPDPVDFLLLCVLGAGGVTGHILMASAMRRAPIGVLTPLDYTHVLFATAYGWLVFQEAPAVGTLLGAPLIVGAGLYLVFSRQHRETGEPP